MMLPGDTMEIRADEVPTEIQNIFKNKFEGDHEWAYQKSIPGEVIVHVIKKAENDIDTTDNRQ